jgi:hypothetical protein
MKPIVVGLLAAAWCAPAAARSRSPVVTLERTACFGTCPVYKVAIDADGAVRWRGEANVAHKGRARGHADPAKVAELVDAFMAARLVDEVAGSRAFIEAAPASAPAAPTTRP